MTFWDEVYRLREEGLIKLVWKRSDIRPHLIGEFSENTIGAYPANSSISLRHHGIGDYVKKGGAPKAWRVGSPRSGNYKLVVDPGDDKTTQQEQRANALARAEELRSAKSEDSTETSDSIVEQPPLNARTPQNYSSQDLAAKLQDVLDAMYDKRRYPLRDRNRKREYPTESAVPVEEWEAMFLEKWDARLNDRP